MVEVAKRVELVLKVSSRYLYFCWPVGPDVLTFLLFLWQDPQDSLVVLSGCGTSGRIAFLIAVKISKEAKKTPDNNRNKHYFKELFSKLFKVFSEQTKTGLSIKLEYNELTIPASCVVGSRVSTEGWRTSTRVWCIHTSSLVETGMQCTVWWQPWYDGNHDHTKRLAISNN